MVTTPRNSHVTSHTQALCKAASTGRVPAAHLARPAPRLAAVAFPPRYRAGTAASSCGAGPKGAPRGIAVQLVLKAARARGYPDRPVSKSPSDQDRELNERPKRNFHHLRASARGA